MADYDLKNDVLPKLVYPKAGTKPTIAAMKAALTTFSAASYTPARLFSMSENDLLYACQLHGLAVVGI